MNLDEPKYWYKNAEKLKNEYYKYQNCGSDFLNQICNQLHEETESYDEKALRLLKELPPMQSHICL